MSVLATAARRFVDAYHRRPDLVDGQKGWRCAIALVASDGDAVTVRVDDGRVVDVLEEGPSGDIVIRSDVATLTDILGLRRSPNEPYVFGELTVQGSEADFLRLDYIATLLCPS